MGLRERERPSGPAELSTQRLGFLSPNVHSSLRPQLDNHEDKHGAEDEIGRPKEFTGQQPDAESVRVGGEGL